MKLSELTSILSEGINDKGIFKAVFFAGTPAAGKTYTLDRITNGSIQPRIVNTDKFYEFLGDITGSDLSKEGSSEIKSKILDKSKYLTKQQLKLYLNSMSPLFIDGTSSNINNILRRAGILESLGYDIAMVWVDSSLETSLKRAESRDRHVDPEFIKRVYELAEENKRFYSEKFSKFYLVNNDGEIDDSSIERIFKKVSNFFTDQVSNPIGKRNIKKLQASSNKYLAPSIVDQEYLDKSVDSWYRRG